ncbi:hypothetical protein LENED_007246 [Lentinula edodes]|uniref:Uncharacterized protein n=1 Tax=Lentinula edodes TaxID=5353 RepID=A0A1Q3EDV3_LENED|nr:hypothetical protein LENED_007246 [Lentinula edodes]
MTCYDHKKATGIIEDTLDVDKIVIAKHGRCSFITMEEEKQEALTTIQLCLEFISFQILTINLIAHRALYSGDDIATEADYIIIKN